MSILPLLSKHASAPINAGPGLEREAQYRLKAVLADLLDEPEQSSHEVQVRSGDSLGADLVADGGGRRWLISVKSSSAPGVLAHAADQIRAFEDSGSISLLVVPFMSAAGAETVESRGVNWVDLSGNAHIRDRDLYIWVQGRPNLFASAGRPASPFAPKSSRVARTLLLDPSRWWRQKELSLETDLDAGRISRVVRRLDEDGLLLRDGPKLRPRAPLLMLEAWADDYRFDRHDIVTGHVSGSGIELARDLAGRLDKADIFHAFTGLPAAWAIDRFASFRLVTVYVHGDPREAADAVGLRRNERGANVQLVGPDDRGVLDGARQVDGLQCVSPAQIYLDLGDLPERAAEAREHLREHQAQWHGRP